MEEMVAQALAIMRGMWRRRWIGLAVAWVVALLGAVFLLRMPERFEATARVYVNTKSVLKPLMRELTVEPDLDQTLQMLARTIITRPNIEILMRKAKLEKPDMTPAEREVLIERLSREIKLTSLGRDNVFNFSYRDTSPTQARVVVEQLVSLFVESDLGAKMRDVDAARGFIDQQIKTYEARLSEAENRLKDFKMRNLGMSDPAGKDYFARISALTEELGKLNLDLRASEQSRDALRRELGGETAVLLPDNAAATMVPQTPELDARLETQRKQLDEHLRRYTDLHPDVVSTRRVIERLEEQKRQEMEVKRRAEAGRPPSTSSTGAAVVQQTKLALAEAEANVAALRVRASDTQSRLAQLRASASRVPQFEAEFAQLNRDYEVVRRNYEALVTQREKAVMSEEIDSTRLAHFRVIDPPRTLDNPVFPSRLAMAPLVLLLALFAGMVATFLVVQLLPTVDSSTSLRRLTRRPVLGSVSMLVSNEMLRQARWRSLGFASGLGVLFIGFGIWMAWLSLPKIA
jgi:polysaccharide chain length determinant protein (PEP-CTERM system associated)